MEYRKVKSVSKRTTPRSPELNKKILSTMRKISDIVGVTLGPGGRQVLIERFEHNLPPKITKDGVTVFRSLGFDDPEAQCIMEAARDASVRTATEAGDGTTSATILTEAIVRLTNEFCERNRRMSPQKVLRHLEDLFLTQVEPVIKSLAIHVDSDTDEGKALMTSVASISANGDVALAKAVIECYDLVGDEGNVTIAEVSGQSAYEVEKIDGYPIPMGYEESCARFMNSFINDPGTQTCRIEDPVFVLYHGQLNEIQSAYPLLAKVGDKFEELIQNLQDEYKHHNVVFVATGFSESVLGTLSAGWAIPNAIKVFPLVIPKFPIHNGQVQFLEDLSAITGAAIFDPLNKPLDSGTLEDLGPGVDWFEASRFRSTIVGKAASRGAIYEAGLMDQIDVVETMLLTPESEVDKILLQERLGKLTGGIAKLKVIGSSNGELKEKRDRAEDAVCSVRGALKYGCLPGGGWTLLKVISCLDKSDPVVAEILAPALMEPVARLLTNFGLLELDIQKVLDPVLLGIKEGKQTVYDIDKGLHGDARELGVLDSVGAVLEAVRNSISAAGLLGTLGGTVVFARDHELERTEARDTAEFLRTVNDNPADNRA